MECIRFHVSSKTLAALNSSIGFLLASITVLRQSVKDVKWKEEESRAQAIFAAMCSLADKQQPPSASSLAVWQEGLCIIVRFCAAQNWSKELFHSQLRFLKKEPVDDCRVRPTFVVGKCKLNFDWMCASVEHEVSVRLLVHHIQNHLPSKVAGVQELRRIVEDHKTAFDQRLFSILHEGELFLQVGLSRQASIRADTSISMRPRLRCTVEGCSRMHAVGYSVCSHCLQTQLAEHFSKRGLFYSMVPSKHTEAVRDMLNVTFAVGVDDTTCTVPYTLWYEYIRDVGE